MGATNKPSAFGEYEGQKLDAARRLIELQNPDGGWALSPYGASSLVNTAEVLAVLAAAQARGEAFDNGARYLSGAVWQHFGEQTEGNFSVRGPNLRYITFTLEGLSYAPEAVFAPDGQRVINRALEVFAPSMSGNALVANWKHRQPSYHQSARALTALSKIIHLDVEDRLDPALRNRALQLCVRLARFLLDEQQPDGAWKLTSQSLPDELSPAKTAVAATALGYFRLLTRDPRVDEARRSAAEWLLEKDVRWRTKREQDDQELGSSWEFLAYAECLRPVVSLGEEATVQVRRSWNFLVRLWSEEQQLWAEPSGSGLGNATIRAAFHTVMAFESAIPTSAVLTPPEIPPRGFGQLTVVRESGGAAYEIEGTDGGFTLSLDRAPKLQQLLEAILRERSGIDSSRLARTLGVSTSSIAVYKSRLNDKAAAQSRGQLRELVRARQVASHDFVYELASASG